jgi:Flp pilus assembly protein TadG
MSHSLHHPAFEERGAVLVFVALLAPVAVLFLSFVIDVGNWFDHARHLQTQADAGALAAAEGFQPCSNPSIYAAAGQYSGASSVTTPTGGSVTASSPLYNPQIGGTTQANIHEVINSPTYYNQPSPVDGTVNASAPCSAGMVDVKVTETNLPWYFNIFNSVPYINAHARVEILQETSARGMEPLAVAQTAPIAAKAYFVNEDKGNEVLASVSLEQISTNAQGQGVWSNEKGIPVPVTINHPHIGVVIALSGNKSDTTCGHEYVECFGRKAEKEKPTLEAAEPALHIAGYSTTGTGTAEKPLAREVTLAGATCPDGYFSAAAENCTLTIKARVDWGAANKEGQKTPTLEAEVAGTKTKLTPKAGTSEWSGTATLPAGTGSREVTLLYECKKESGSPCAETKKVTFKEVHRIYAGSVAHSGSIAGTWIGASGGAPQDANTFSECGTCTQKLVVTVDVAGSLSVATGFADPVRRLKFEGNHGVIVGCPPNTAGESASEFRERLEKGCPGTYKINTSNPACTVNVEPFDCLKVNANGKKKGAIKGFEKRIESTPGKTFYCANNWQDTNNGGIPLLPSDDSRIVQVFIMPYGSLDSTGEAVLPSGEVQIQDFAAFYVTGFPGDRCGSDPSTAGTEIVGHFIEYVNPLGVSGEGKCVASSLGECVAVLTR